MAGPLAAAGKMATFWNKNTFSVLRVAAGRPLWVAPRRLCSKKPEDGVEKHQQQTPPETASNDFVFRDVVYATKWKKKILLLTRRYKREEDIPDEVSNSLMQNAMSVLRMYISCGIIAFILFSFFVAAWSGKRAAEQRRDRNTTRVG